MFKLFKKKDKFNLDLKISSVDSIYYTNIMPKIRGDLLTAMEDTRGSSKYADAKDIMVRLLKHVVTPPDTLEELVFKNSIYLTSMCRLYGFFTSSTKGKVIHDPFMNNEKAVFILEDDDINISTMERYYDKWRDVKALKVIYTDSTDLSMNVPSKYTNTLNVRSLYSLNVNSLVSSYLGYLDAYPDGSPKEYVYKYVYSNLMGPLYNHALVNNTIAQYTGGLIEDYNPVRKTMKRDRGPVYRKIASRHFKPERYKMPNMIINNIVTMEDTTFDIYQIPDIRLTSYQLALIVHFTSDTVRYMLELSSPKTARTYRARTLRYLSRIKGFSRAIEDESVFGSYIVNMTMDNIETIKKLR